MALIHVQLLAISKHSKQHCQAAMTVHSLLAWFNRGSAQRFSKQLYPWLTASLYLEQHLTRHDHVTHYSVWLIALSQEQIKQCLPLLLKSQGLWFHQSSPEDPMRLLVLPIDQWVGDNRQPCGWHSRLQILINYCSPSAKALTTIIIIPSSKLKRFPLDVF